MKILVVMGTRPEAIKLAPVVTALRRRKEFGVLVCATAQHRELLDQVLRVFRLKPDIDLDLMTKGQTHGALYRRVHASLGPILGNLRPSLVIVQGDTTTALAAARCASERGIPVAHVEAGLRSFDLKDPYPEELNRTTIDRVAALHFPPTPAARANLAREGVRGDAVYTTGNTVVDALRSARGRARPAARGKTEVLVTLHRREIHGAPLRRVCAALTALVKARRDLTLLYPVHPNPAVATESKRLLRHPRIKLLKPLAYPEFLALLKRAAFVVTDSGGVQEEAVSLGKPLLVVRANTERPEVLRSGAGRLTGLDPKSLTRWTERLLDEPALRRKMSGAKNLYGDGRASARVAAGIAHWFGLGPRPKDWKP